MPKDIAFLDSNSEITLFTKESILDVIVNGDLVHFSFSQIGNFVSIKLDRVITPFDRVIIETENRKFKVFPGHILLNNKYETDQKLGNFFTYNSTSFKVWAPGPNRIFVEVFTMENLKKPIYDLVMENDKTGVWTTSIKKQLFGFAYRYRIERYGEIIYTHDPYAKACTLNSEFSYIIDFEKIRNGDLAVNYGPRLKSPLEAIIYETHVDDLTHSWTSGSKTFGKYDSLQNNTKTPINTISGIDYLNELGITHVHLMPVQDYSNDEVSEDYNWGYDPSLYNVPEGIYSNEPSEPQKRIYELKGLINRLHENNIGVILDVVYNHTFQTEESCFQKLVPFYYYRLTQNREFSNGSGCGNEIATERPMVRKFIIDSLKHWISDYNVDGFRFDLMGLMGTNTMKYIEKELRRIKKNIFLYGEPWTAGSTTIQDRVFFKGEQRGTGIAVFNDDLRNALKGYLDDYSKGFVTGEKDKELEVAKGIVGEINYSRVIRGFSSEPTEVINYSSCHDNLTLWDKILKSTPHMYFDEHKKRAALALSIILTSQGIPFIHSGSEMIRTKALEENSYNSGHFLNEINYHRKDFYEDYFKYISGLIHFRKSENLFKLKTSMEIRERLSFIHAADGKVAFIIRGKDHEIIVIHNSTNKEYKIEQSGNWKIIAQNFKIDIDGLKYQNGIINCYPISSTIGIKNI